MIKIILDKVISFPIGVLDAEIENTFFITNPEYLSICNRRKINVRDRPKGYILAKYKEAGKWKSRKVAEKLIYWKRIEGYYQIPRSAFFTLKTLLKKHKIKYSLVNKRKTFKPLGLTFKGELKKELGQNAVLNYKYKSGILEAPTGSGKTCMALYIAAKIDQPFMVIVDTQELQNQWKERINQFLGIPKKQIGHIGGGVIDVKKITVALIQTLKKNTDVLKEFGFIIVDECHIVATESYEIAVNNYPGKYILGLSATPKRSDGKTDLMLWLLGKIKVKVQFKDAKRTETFVKFIPTNFTTKLSFKYQYSSIMVELTKNEDRNKLITETIINNSDIPGVHLIISQSSKHLKYLYNLLPEKYQYAARILIGEVKGKNRKDIVADIKKGNIKYIYATSQLLGKGFDEPLLSVLHLGTPIKDPDRLTQFVGRITRLLPGKEKSYIFDYYDAKEYVLSSSTKIRSNTYKGLDIKRI